MLRKRSPALSMPVQLRPEGREACLIQGPRNRQDMILLHMAGKTMLNDHKRASAGVLLLQRKARRELQLRVKRYPVMIHIKLPAGDPAFFSVFHLLHL